MEQKRNAKDSFQIKMGINADSESDAQDVVFQISRIINRLARSKIGQYIFLCSFYGDDDHLPDENEWAETMKSFIESNEERFDISFNKMNVMVANKDCKLNGCILGYLIDNWAIHNIHFW